MVNNDIQERSRAARWDDRVLGLIMVALGGLRVVLAFAGHERWGAEASIAAIMTALGLVLLLLPSRR